MIDLDEQRHKAAEDIRKMKVVAPHVFPEWTALHQAVQRLQEAYKAVEEAQKAWDNLGKED